MEKIAVFPGSFDPITRGHESIVKRAIPLFDKIIIAVGENSEKKPFFKVEERIGFLNKVFDGFPNIEVITYKGLTIDFCQKKGAQYILRGLRTSADFEFERSIGQINRKLMPGLEIVFLLADPELSSVNSSIIRDILKHGGDPSQFVPSMLNLKSYVHKKK